MAEGDPMNPPDPQKIAYTIRQAVAVTGIGRSKLYEMIRDGEIVAVKIRGQRLIERAEIEALFPRAKTSASATAARS
jgi:excisionase family DNA binding protein